MEHPIRTLIDYATGENWEMPLYLYEQFEQEKKELPCHCLTPIQYWISTLSEEEMKQVRKR